MHKNIQKTSESNMKINNSDNNDLNDNSISEKSVTYIRYEEFETISIGIIKKLSQNAVVPNNRFFSMENR